MAAVEMSEWFPLTRAGVDEHAPRAAAAVQLRRASGLVTYPAGRSAMVFYFFAQSDARAALLELFADEIEAPGARGQGPLWFRFAAGPRAKDALESLYGEFIARFGRAPLFHDDEG